MKIRSQLNLSAKKIGDAGKLLAQDMGMKLEPYFDKLLVKKGHELDEFFDVTTVQFEAMEVDENTGKKVKCMSEKTLVYCKDVEALVLHIKEKRGFSADDENIFFKIGLDSGRGFLKICMTMQQMPTQKHDSDSDSDPMIEVERPTKNKFKDSGVKRLIILGLVENGMETYNNVKILMDILGVNTLSFSKSVSVDLKMVNLLIGMKITCTFLKIHIYLRSQIIFQVLDLIVLNIHVDGALAQHLLRKKLPCEHLESSRNLQLNLPQNLMETKNMPRIASTVSIHLHWMVQTVHLFWKFVP